MIYLGYILFRHVLIYNPEVSFNFHLTFLQLDVINVHCAVKTVFYLTLGYFLRTFFDFPSRFELWGVECKTKKRNQPVA